MNRFISALFLFEKRLYSKVNHKIMQIDFPDAHTDTRTKTSETPKQQTSVLSKWLRFNW